MKKHRRKQENRHTKHGKFYKEIYQRDEGVCQLCGRLIDPNDKKLWMGTLDHIVPRSKGGADEPSNLRLAHMICNALRGNNEDVNEIGEETLQNYRRGGGNLPRD